MAHEKADAHHQMLEQMEQGASDDAVRLALTNRKLSPLFRHTDREVDRFLNSKAAQNARQRFEKNVRNESIPREKTKRLRSSPKEVELKKGFPIKKSLALLGFAILVVYVGYQLGFSSQTGTPASNDNNPQSTIPSSSQSLKDYSECLTFKKGTNVNELLKEKISQDSRLQITDLNPMLEAVAATSKKEKGLKTEDYTLSYNNKNKNFNLKLGCIPLK